MLSAIGFTPHELFPDDRFVRFSSGGDVDGDGDQDLISGWVFWHENVDGAGSFADPVTITTEETDTPIDAFMANVDGDSNPDLLMTLTPSRTPSFVNISAFAWYESNNGAWVFRDRFGGFADAADFADADGDGDPDLLTLDGLGVGWHENDRGTFLDRQLIWTMPESQSPGRPTPSVHASDIDADGDMDALSINRDRDVMFHENVDGRGTYVTRPLIENASPRPQSVLTADLDGDNDLDILTVLGGGGGGRCTAAASHNTCSIGAVEFAWYENTGTDGTLGTKQVISSIPKTSGSIFINGPRPSGTDYVTGMRAVDFDGDGDQDVLAYSSLRKNNDSDAFLDKIVWFENLDGKGTFADEQFISTKTNGLKSIDVVDLDGDDDLDVLASYGHFNRFTETIFGNIVWFENEKRILGDSNRDGIFDSADLVAAFQAGEYEDDLTNNSTFEKGDWNSDGDFDSGDLVAAFQSGEYVGAAPMNVFAVDRVFNDDRDQDEFLKTASQRSPDCLHPCSLSGDSVELPFASSIRPRVPRTYFP